MMGKVSFIVPPRPVSPPCDPGVLGDIYAITHPTPTFSDISSLRNTPIGHLFAFV